MTGISTSITTRSGLERTGLLDAVETVLGLADDDHVRLLIDERGDRAPEQRLVVDQQDADRSCRCCTITSRMRRPGNLGRRRRSASRVRGRVDRQGTADEAHPLAHRVQAEPVPPEQRATEVEATAVVLDLDLDAVLAFPEPDDDTATPRRACGRS